MGTDLPHPGAIAPSRDLLATDHGDLLEALRAIATLAPCRHDEVDQVAIWLFDDADGPLRCVARHDRATGRVEHDLVLQIDDAPAFLRAVTSAPVMAIADAEHDPRTCELADRWIRPRGIGSAVVAPCRCDGQVFALLAYVREGHPRPWSAETRDEAEQLAKVVEGLGRASGPKRAPSPDDGVLDAISRERRLLEQVLHQLPSGVVLADTQGRLILQNAESERILGGRIPIASELWDLGQATSLPKSDLPLFRALHTGEQVVREEIPVSLPDGRELWLSVNSGPVRNDEGEVIAAVAAFRDVTERRRTALALEEEGRLREQFMAILGHDLRTPAAAMLMSAQLLLRSGALDPYQATLAQRIISSGRRMERMIRELLDLGLIRAGRIQLVRARCDLASLCEEVVEELRSTWPDRDVDVRLDAPAPGLWDADRLAQVVSNLVGNALAHGSPDQPVRLRLAAEEHEACVEIRNVGHALSPERMETLFQPFHGSSRRSPHSGLGLGLFISHAIVSAHGGTIALETSGSEVVVTLRLPWDGAASAPAR